jgi:hypothetical protein
MCHEPAFEQPQAAAAERAEQVREDEAPRTGCPPGVDPGPLTPDAIAWIEQLAGGFAIAPRLAAARLRKGGVRQPLLNDG